jgi:hypothetical protein
VKSIFKTVPSVYRILICLGIRKRFHMPNEAFVYPTLPIPKNTVQYLIWLDHISFSGVRAVLVTVTLVPVAYIFLAVSHQALPPLLLYPDLRILIKLQGILGPMLPTCYNTRHVTDYLSCGAKVRSYYPPA